MPAATAHRTRRSKYVPTCQRARTVCVLCWSPVSGIGCVRVTEGGKADRYHLEELPCDFPGRAFRVEKHGEEAASSYDVTVNGRLSGCECKGFLRHRHCRHVEMLLALEKAGKL